MAASPRTEAKNRIASNFWDPETQWLSLATDLWVTGQLQANLGYDVEAKPLLERALEIWKTKGEQLPNRQAKAVRQLEALIAATALRTG